MHIAQIAPLTEAMPPKLYGGTERVVSWLTEELIALGHEVTLFASGDLVTSARSSMPFWPRALRLDGSVRDPNALHMMMLEQVRQRADEFDFLHFHLDYYPFSLFSRQPTPFVTTLHGRLDLPEHQPVFDTFSSVPVVSISNAQRRPLAAGQLGAHRPSRIAGKPAARPADQAVLLRFSRPHRAGKGRRSRHPYCASIAACRSKIAAKVDNVDREYFEEQILPLMKSAQVDYIGEINDKHKSEFLSGAMALLVPIDWPEPFGLVMIEAMACGTPVIAFNRGSVPEVIDDGVTGFIVEDEQRRHRRRRPTEPPVAAKDSAALRAAVHGAPDGPGLSFGLSQHDGPHRAASATGFRRRAGFVALADRLEPNSAGGRPGSCAGAPCRRATALVRFLRAGPRLRHQQPGHHKSDRRDCARAP